MDMLAFTLRSGRTILIAALAGILVLFLLGGIMKGEGRGDLWWLIGAAILAVVAYWMYTAGFFR